ncbi:MAG: AlwI family type II restriction endonuclease [Anaerovoracaceae bacterium]
MAKHFTYKSYAWSLGTTSFRMADFHRKVEEQLILLDAFWNVPENKSRIWKSNAQTQSLYYDFLFEKGFISGEIQNSPDKKSKTARQKTSGLVDIGLIYNDRRLTPVGKKLLDMCRSGDFSCDNEFQIPRDSYLYLKQILKTVYKTEDWKVRPFLAAGKVLMECDGYLSEKEFTYLLPLCVSEDITKEIIKQIRNYREGKTTLNRIITESVLCRYNYPSALHYFVHSAKTPEDIMVTGMNRDGIRHDACYTSLYQELKRVYLDRKQEAIPSLMKAARAVKNKPGTLWRGLLFSNARRCTSFSDLAPNDFDSVHTEEQFDRCFFSYLHLNKIKATLRDYMDLNRRYLKITDAFLFEDGKVTFTPFFDYFFRTNAGKVFEDTFSDCDLLTEDCDIETINKHLRFHENEVIRIFNAENALSAHSLEEVYDFLENDRYLRFRKLIDTRFPDPVILSMLDKFESRDQDADLISLAGGEADVPTIFEYIVAVVWYRISGYTGKILDYMNLSLDMNLLPRTHAGGGESDIVYKYAETPFYPSHSLLIECTLMEGTTQRHGEMEPVSRHLANYMIDEDENAYCTFVSNNLHASVISDFRMRRSFPYYRNERDHVNGMKIIPLHTRELKRIIEKKLSYAQLYKIFDDAFVSDEEEAPPAWYDTCVRGKIDSIQEG